MQTPNPPAFSPQRPSATGSNRRNHGAFHGETISSNSELGVARRLARKPIFCFFLCLSFTCFAAPANSGTSYKEDLSWPKLEAPETIVSGVEILKPKGFADLYQTFLEPIYRSDFYSVIHRINIDTGSRDASLWTVDIYLETGEHIALRTPNSFYDTTDSETPFKKAAKRVLGQLEAVLKANSKLKKFFHEHFPKHRNA